MKNNKQTMIFVAAVFIFIGQLSTTAANEYILDDAERFSTLFSITSLPTEKQIKAEYLTLGSKGIDIFTPHRIQNEKKLALAISANPQAYKKGLEICLPAARNITSEAKQVLKRVQELLAQKHSAPTFILFGADNSGGTATSEGFSLGLEVICRLPETEEEAEEEILGFIAHEIVHVYQSRNINVQTKNVTLLRQALIEGFADFVANIVLGKITQAENERHHYGLKNEALIWSEFKDVMLGSELKSWLYGPGIKGRPNDLGYWLGKRIVKAYYEKSDNKKQALKKLLSLDDPEFILRASAYDPK